MRLSVRPGSRHHWAIKGYPRAPSIVLDGEVQREVVEVDDEAGYVDRFAKDEWGRTRVEKDEVVIERVYGRVTLVPFPL